MGVQLVVHVLCQPPIVGRRRAAEVVKRQAQLGIQGSLLAVHRVAVFLYGQPRLPSRQVGRCPVFIGGADEGNFLPFTTQEAGVHIRGQQRSHQVSQVFYAIDVGQRAGDEVLGQGVLLSVG